MIRRVTWLLPTAIMLMSLLVGRSPRLTATQPSPVHQPTSPPATLPDPFTQDILPYTPSLLQAAPDPIVLPIYFVPSDITPDPHHLDFINQQMQLVQAWYGWQLSGSSFELAPVVQVVSSHPLAWFYPSTGSDQDGGGSYGYWLWDKISAELAERGYAGVPQRVVGIFFDHAGRGGAALGAGSSSGGGQFLVSVERLADDCDLPGCSARISDAGLAHELGHALGLPHPDDDPNGISLMSWAMYGFPEISFLESEKEVLRNNPLIRSWGQPSNGGFEQGLGSWKAEPAVNLTWSTTRHSGLHALKLAPASAGDYTVSQKMSVFGGQRYQLNLWARFDSLPGDKGHGQPRDLSYSINAELLDSHDEIISSLPLEFDDGYGRGWVQLGASLATTSDVSAIRLAVRVFELPITRTMLLDDVLLQPTASAPPRLARLLQSTSMPFDSVRPTLHWGESLQASSYDVEIADNTGFVDPWIEANTSYAMYQPPADMPWNKTYYWRVRARNARGPGPWLLGGRLICQQGGAYQSDEFEQSSLAPAWSWVREDKGNWLFDGPSGKGYNGELAIRIQPGSIAGGNTTAKNILLRPVQGTQVEVTTHLRFWRGVPISNTEQAGLLAYQDDDHYAKLTRGYNDGYVVSLAAENGGQASIYTTTVRQTDIHLKLERDGDSYRGFFSADGLMWEQVGPQVSLHLAGGKMGLVAYGGRSTQVFNANFDWFRVMSLDPKPEQTPTATPTSTSASTATATPTSTSASTATATPTATLTSPPTALPTVTHTVAPAPAQRSLYLSCLLH